MKNNIENIFNAEKEEVIRMTSNISKGLELLKKEGKEEGLKEGKLEGKAEMLIKLLMKKFNFVPQDYIDKIESLPETTVEKIATDIFDIEKVEELEKYLKNRR